MPKVASKSLSTSTGEEAAARHRDPQRRGHLGPVGVDLRQHAPSTWSARPANMRDLLAAHELQRLAGLEARQEHEGGAAAEAGVHDRRSGRRSGTAAARRGRRRRPRSRGEHLVADHGVDQHVLVGELGALGLAGGAAGVEDHRGVVRSRSARSRTRRASPSSAAQSVSPYSDSVASGVAGSTKKCSAAGGRRSPPARARPAAARGCPRSRTAPWRRSRRGGRRSRATAAAR